MGEERIGKDVQGTGRRPAVLNLESRDPLGNKFQGSMDLDGKKITIFFSLTSN